MFYDFLVNNRFKKIKEKNQFKMNIVRVWKVKFNSNEQQGK